MARTRATAVSAVVLAVGLTAVGVAPFVGQSASASVSVFDPAVEPCDAGQTCDPETTVTVTTTLGSPTEEAPETTVTKTVTASPTRTKASPTPTPKKSTTPPAQTQQPPQQNPATQNPQPLPSQNLPVPPVSTPESTPTDTGVEMPQVASDTPSPPAAPVETPAAGEEEVPLELRNAAPEYDQRTLTQKLSIPALILVLLALFAVLIFEGRLRRMAHAAAVRKAGPQAARPDGVPPGYPPAAPGYATAAFPAPGYPGGTAYAPIISFVPVQTYPGGPVQYGPVYQDPSAAYAGQPPAYAPEGHNPAAPGPVVLPPEEFQSYGHQPPVAPQPPQAPEPSQTEPSQTQQPQQPGRQEKPYRDLFEPLVPAADIPPGGARPYEEEPKHPMPPAAAAEPGDSEPWQQAAPAGPGEVTRVEPLPSTQDMPGPSSSRRRRRRK